MPKVFFRLLAVLLLALAVPVQGVAAVTAGQCMAFGHHHGADSQDDHGHAHSHDHGGAEHDDNSSKSPHCGPCTDCCASASIAGPVGISIASSPSNATYLFSQFPPIGFQPSGLDRPPLAL